MILLVRQLGLLAACALFSYLCGALLTAKIPFASLAEALAMRCGTGLAALSMLALGLALAHALTIQGLIIAAAVLLSAGATMRRGHVVEALKLPRASPQWGWILVGVLLLLSFGLSLYPATGFDATMYHLPAARLHLARSALAYSPYIRLNFLPQAWEIVYSLALLCGTDVSAQLVNWLALLLTTVATAALANRLGAGRAAPLAAALWLSHPVAIDAGSQAGVDVALALFVTLGITALVAWWQTRQPGWIAVGGFLLGIASATKYAGLFFLAITSVALLALTLRSRRKTPIVLFGSLALLPLAPWIARTTLAAGTPFGLYLTTVFGRGWLQGKDVARLMWHQAQYGFPHTLGNFLTFPIDLVVRSDAYREGHGFTAAWPLAVALASVAAVLCKEYRPIYGLAVAYFLFWFLTYQNGRLLIPVSPMIATGGAIGVKSLALRVPRLRPRAERVLLLLLTAACVASPLSPIALRFRVRGPVPLTETARDAYLSRVPGYRAIAFVNREHGTKSRVYALFGENLNYFAQGCFLGDWFGPDAFSTVLHELVGPGRLYSHMSHLGVTHLLIKWPTAAPANLTEARAKLDALPESFRLVYRKDNVDVFAVTAAPGATRTDAPDCLSRPDETPRISVQTLRTHGTISCAIKPGV